MMRRTTMATVFFIIYVYMWMVTLILIMMKFLFISSNCVAIGSGCRLQNIKSLLFFHRSDEMDLVNINMFGIVQLKMMTVMMMMKMKKTMMKVK